MWSKLKWYIIIFLAGLLTAISLGKWNKSKKIIEDAQKEIYQIDDKIKDKQEEYNEIKEEIDNIEYNDSLEKLNDKISQQEKINQEQKEKLDKLKEGGNNDQEDSNVDTDHLNNILNN